MEVSLGVFFFALLVGLALSTNQQYGSRYSNYGSRYNNNYGSRYGNYGYGNRRRCSSPSHPQYGGYYGDDDYYSIGHKVTYYCNDGYELYGSQYSTCKYSSRSYRGYWDNSAPYCKRMLRCIITLIIALYLVAVRKTCSKLDAPENGAVKQTGTYPGDRASYRCSRGYNLVGSDKRICQRNGEWSKEAPICQRKRLT